MKLFVKKSIINKLRQRNKFIREFKIKARYWRENPVKFIEEMCGVKLYWYQKIMIELTNGNKIISTPSKHPIRSKIHKFIK